jgi:hypothetical protein
MHFFKAFTILATVAFAAVAVALPAPGTTVESDNSACEQLVGIIGNVNAKIHFMANGENPIKLEKPFKLISVPGTIPVLNGTSYLGEYVQDIFDLGINPIQCSLDDLNDIARVSSLFASQPVNTNGNGMLIVRQRHRNRSCTTCQQAYKC